MKYWMSIVLLILLAGHGLAQSAGTQPQEPPYKRFPTVPPISLLQTDSSTLTRDDLPKNHPVMIMYFSPTCEHCIHQMEDMLKENDALKHYEIVMATYQPFDEMVEFYKKYNLAHHTNYRMGRDTQFSLPPFFVIKSLPFFALYDKKGKLITTFEGNVKVDSLVKAFSGK